MNWNPLFYLTLTMNIPLQWYLSTDFSLHTVR